MLPKTHHVEFIDTNTKPKLCTTLTISITKLYTINITKNYANPQIKLQHYNTASTKEIIPSQPPIQKITYEHTAYNNNMIAYVETRHVPTQATHTDEQQIYIYMYIYIYICISIYVL